MTRTERFAPSPTGPLHLGHAFSALAAWDQAVAENGRFMLRVEDIDFSRARTEWEELIFEDLAWLGLHWETPVLRQSQRISAYRTALKTLWDRNLLYVCKCTRKDIATAASAPQEGAPNFGPDGIIYPGTCRKRVENRPALIEQLPRNVTLRLDMASAAGCIGDHRITDRTHGMRVLHFQETGERHKGQHQFEPKTLIETVGDIVLARAGMNTSYHLSVVLDDAFQRVTHVTRGEDLFDATKIHVLLQALLGLPTPIYHHHRLIRDSNGKRLAKRDDARAIRSYRLAGNSPEDIRSMVGL